jgi:hypothetical protein
MRTQATSPLRHIALDVGDIEKLLAGGQTRRDNTGLFCFGGDSHETRTTDGAHYAAVHSGAQKVIFIAFSPLVLQSRECALSRAPLR